MLAEDAGIPKKKLILRLSSLGDVVLATAVLESVFLEGGVDWVVAQEYASLLKGHPRIRRLWVFDRSAGLRGWVSLCRELWGQNYDEVFDLHSSLRTRLARKLFKRWSGELPARGSRNQPIWKKITKPGWKLYGFFLLKGLWPKRWRPKPVFEEFVRLVGGQGHERPNLKHLEIALEEPWARQPFLCVMPGSAWRGKRWPVRHFLEVLRKTEVTPVILGSDRDRDSHELVAALQKESKPFISGIGKWDLAKNAQVLAASVGYLGNDTGLAHLAQALGVPATVIFGPTVPDMGFGTWLAESPSVGISMWCRPCGKDGRFCHRVIRRHACLKSLEPGFVLAPLHRMIRSRQSQLRSQTLEG